MKAASLHLSMPSDESRAASGISSRFGSISRWPLSLLCILVLSFLFGCSGVEAETSDQGSTVDWSPRTVNSATCESRSKHACKQNITCKWKKVKDCSSKKTINPQCKMLPLTGDECKTSPLGCKEKLKKGGEKVCKYKCPATSASHCTNGTHAPTFPMVGGCLMKDHCKCDYNSNDCVSRCQCEESKPFCSKCAAGSCEAMPALTFAKCQSGKQGATCDDSSQCVDGLTSGVWGLACIDHKCESGHS